jgi:hypothetical protein
MLSSAQALQAPAATPVIASVVCLSERPQNKVKDVMQKRTAHVLKRHRLSLVVAALQAGQTGDPSRHLCIFLSPARAPPPHSCARLMRMPSGRRHVQRYGPRGLSRAPPLRSRANHMIFPLSGGWVGRCCSAAVCFLRLQARIFDFCDHFLVVAGVCMVYVRARPVALHGHPRPLGIPS